MMFTLTLFLVLMPTPRWTQDEGVACGWAMAAKAPVYVLATFGFKVPADREDRGILDESYDRLEPRYCEEVKTRLIGGMELTLFRMKPLGKYCADGPEGMVCAESIEKWLEETHFRGEQRRRREEIIMDGLVDTQKLIISESNKERLIPIKEGDLIPRGGRTQP